MRLHQQLGCIAAVALAIVLVGCAKSEPASLSGFGSMRTIVTSNVEYKRAYGTFAPSLQSLGGKMPCVSSRETACLIDPVLASGHKSGYTFIYTPSQGSAGNIIHYSVSAEPDDKPDVWYYTDDTGVIRREKDRKANSTSPAIE